MSLNNINEDLNTINNHSNEYYCKDIINQAVTKILNILGIDRIYFIIYDQQTKFQCPIVQYFRNMLILILYNPPFYLMY